MPELPDFFRDLTRKLQVAFDRQWSSVWGLRTLTRANRIVWGTRGPLELDGVESISLGAVAVLARHDSHLRETELMAVYPAHVVCAWLGNTPKVAMKHYLQVTEEDYRKASESPTDRQAG